MTAKTFEFIGLTLSQSKQKEITKASTTEMQAPTKRLLRLLPQVNMATLFSLK